jgi:predicted DNA-binding transcriptional regulator YafY
MAGKDKTRQRLILIIRYLKEYGENGEKINIKHLQNYLAEQSSNRQIIYNDLRVLEQLGADIKHTKNGHYIYMTQGFTNGELMLLADGICSSSFLTAKKAEELILHIKQMTNMKRFDDLAKDIDVVLRNKTMNESCIKNIEHIHDAIKDKKQVEFSYAKYDSKGKLWYAAKAGDQYEKVFVETNKHVPLGDEKPHIHLVSPYKMVWDNSQCYLICGKKNYNKRIKIMNFRADRIYNLSSTNKYIDKLNSSNEFYDPKNKGLDIEKYMSSIFEMYGSKNGDLTTVKFIVSNSLKGAMIDKFGKEIRIREYDNEHSLFSAQIQISKLFFGWLAKFSYNDLRVIEPKELVDTYKNHLRSILDDYDVT